MLLPYSISPVKPSSVNQQWVRPVDWPYIKPLGPTDQGLSGLYAVFNTDSNYFSIKITGTGILTINFGDGTGDYTLTSGVQFDYQLSYANAVAQSGLLAEGYAAVVINVTTTGTITGIDLSVKNATSGLGNYASQWLDINLGSPNMSAFALRAANTVCRFLQRINVVSWSNSITSMFTMFATCPSLVIVQLPPNTSQITSAHQTFFYNAAMKSLPVFDTSSITDANQMCTNATNLQQLILDLPACTDISSIASNCWSLQTAKLTNTRNVTNAQSAFTVCYALIDVEPMDLSSVTAGNFASTFSGNGSLAKAAMINPKVSISFANCNLSIQALYDIFAGLFNSVSGQSITITGNYGEAKATSCSISSNVLTVGGTVTGAFKVGMNLAGSGITLSGSTYYTISSFGTGTGGAGTYNLTPTGSPGSPSGVTVYGVPGNAHTIVANGWSIVN